MYKVVIARREGRGNPETVDSLDCFACGSQ
jgi:hypothetical protein